MFPCRHKIINYAQRGTCQLGLDFFKKMTILHNNVEKYFPTCHFLSYLCRPKKQTIMARVCEVTGKKPITGNKVSHSNIKTKRRFLPNLQTKRYFLAEENRWITLKLSSEGIRTINKNGLLEVVKEMRAKGVKI